MDLLSYVKNAIDVEADSIKKLSENVGPEFESAITLLANCKGKVVITGVGKSGHIGKKIAASLASTGTPAFFVHSTEGVHGDLGMIQENDVVIMISNSGETGEVLSLLPSIGKIGCKKIAITSKSESTLAKACDVALVYQYDREADPLGLAPTTSSTLTLVIGDALAVALSILKGFKKEDFHLYHPGGSLGKQLSEKAK
ncbi:KpsF/GutQ family sugar-phosphate isomerase [Robertmurraya yapensis]|uniref:KpsF/GutQ family sugar-phosphate isomerase n=2 Tax=Bacillaceae TaxID=186817 RepID=A0A3S0KWS9_9BACI|nr:SIS domain-containing protein [Bacillus yapensis]RTR36108.1 KpsF/GutQ family sugar-phosphate isomerase [Bacillus yapensis]TKT05611.1 KpsF/GutQ family sugar-phosphate isomerase [Bacillus yapensis]